MPAAAAHDRLVVQLVDDADARREVVRVGLHEAAILERAVAGEDQRLPVPGRIEVRLVVVRLERRRDEVVAQAEVQRQVAVHLPVVLHEAHRRPVPLLDDEDVRELEVGDVAEQEVAPSGCR